MLLVRECSYEVYKLTTVWRQLVHYFSAHVLLFYQAGESELLCVLRHGSEICLHSFRNGVDSNIRILCNDEQYLDSAMIRYAFEVTLELAWTFYFLLTHSSGHTPTFYRILEC